MATRSERRRKRQAAREARRQNRRAARLERIKARKSGRVERIKARKSAKIERQRQRTERVRTKAAAGYWDEANVKARQETIRGLGTSALQLGAGVGAAALTGGGSAAIGSALGAFAGGDDDVYEDPAVVDSYDGDEGEASGGMSTTTMLAIGGALVVGVILLTQKKGR